MGCTGIDKELHIRVIARRQRRRGNLRVDSNLRLLRYARNDVGSVIYWLKKNLPSPRFRHTLEVTRLACKLAMINKCDIKQTCFASLLHDCSKGMSYMEIKNYAQKHHINRNANGCNVPELLHSHVSAHIARTEFNVSDKTVLQAISSHTTGAVNPSLLDKILYIADVASTDRTFPEAARIRRIAVKDLEQALLMAMETKIFYVLKGRCPLHKDTAIIWNSNLP